VENKSSGYVSRKPQKNDFSKNVGTINNNPSIGQAIKIILKKLGTHNPFYRDFKRNI